MIAVPNGYFLGIFARSSTPLKRGLMVANGVGVIDADYCGPADEIKIQVLNITDAPVKVTAGDRLAQGIVLPCPPSSGEGGTRCGRPPAAASAARADDRRRISDRSIGDRRWAMAQSATRDRHDPQCNR